MTDSLDPAISALAERILNKEAIDQAEEFATLLTSDQHMRWHVIEELQKYVGMMPKDPIYFLNQDLRKLPRETRDVVWYAGEYIDQFIKKLAFRAGAFFLSLSFLRKRALRSPLGENLRRLRDVIPEPLFTDLMLFNASIYIPARAAPAKNIPAREFTAREAIYICFIMKNLESKIRPTVEAAGL